MHITKDASISRTADGQGITDLRDAISRCKICAPYLPNPPRPLAFFSGTARIVIIGQAPGRLAHESGIAWNDPSGRRLREWMDVDETTFFDQGRIAIVPMGFCFPGTGSSGDLPPRPECAPRWQGLIGEMLPAGHLRLLVGNYAQAAYLPKATGQNLVDRVRWSYDQDSNQIVLPHPSWRVTGWMKRNPWFESEIIPWLRRRIDAALKQESTTS